MNPTQIVEKIRDTVKARVYIASTGAGAGLQQLLWGVPGTSSFLVGASFPYATDATDDFLGFKPERFCSADTAVDLAMESFYRAYKADGAPAVGIGITASVASLKPHRGDHRVFVAYFSEKGCEVQHAILPKGEGSIDRARDGLTVDLLGLGAIQSAVGVYSMAPSPDGLLTSDAVTVEWECYDAADIARERFFKHPYFLANRTREQDPSAAAEHTTFFPGAFNPPHKGHFEIAKTYMREMGHGVVFSTTTNPPHKEALSTVDLLKRAKLLDGHNRYFSSSDPLYIDKAREFPGARFIIGADALLRMFDSKWCPDPKALCDEFQNLGTSFFVVDRLVDGQLLGLRGLLESGSVPSNFPGRTLNGRWDLSSSQIRAAKSA